MKKENIDVKKRFEKIRQLMAKARSSHRGKSKQEIVEKIRKTREKLWEEKLAARSR